MVLSTPTLSGLLRDELTANRTALNFCLPNFGVAVVGNKRKFLGVAMTSCQIDEVSRYFKKVIFPISMSRKLCKGHYKSETSLQYVKTAGELSGLGIWLWSQTLGVQFPIVLDRGWP